MIAGSMLRSRDVSPYFAKLKIAQLKPDIVRLIDFQQKLRKTHNNEPTINYFLFLRR